MSTNTTAYTAEELTAAENAADQAAVANADVCTLARVILDAAAPLIAARVAEETATAAHPHACPVTGEGIVEIDHSTGQLTWRRADPEVHVAAEVLAEAEGRAFLAHKYDIGQPCPVRPGTYHARKREAP